MNNKRILIMLSVAALALGLPYLFPKAVGPSKPASTSTSKPGAPATTAAPAPPAQPAPTAQPQRTAAERAARASAQTLGQVETDSYSARVSNLNGGLTSFALKGKQFLVAGKPLDMVSTDKEEYLPLAVDIAGWPRADATFALEPRSPRELLPSLEQAG